MSKSKSRYYKTITLCLNEFDAKLLEGSVAYISWYKKKNVPLSHFLRFMIQHYSEDTKTKFIKEEVKINDSAS